MLYDEFLNGTGATDNAYNFAEYRRIEKIYINSDSMSKADAYKLYVAPNDFIVGLMAQNSRLQSQVYDLKSKLDGAETALQDATRKYEAEKRWNREYIGQLRRELSDALYTIEDKLGVL